MSMDFINSPYYNNHGLPLAPTGTLAPNFGAQQQMYPQQQQQMPMQPQINLAALETPKIVAGGGKSFFSVIKEGSNEKGPVVPVDLDVSDSEKEAKKRGTGRSRKESGSSNSIIRAGEDNNAVITTIDDNVPTIYSYMETNALLHETLGQIDSLNAELMKEFNNVRLSRTMKNKYNVLVGLSENVGSLINNRISVIKEINSTITKSNDVDYKKEKDRRIATASVDDDKYIADLYKSFMQNPNTSPALPQVPQVDPSIFGSGVVRADLRSGNIASNGPVDVGYLSYVSNLSPEQNMMRYEGNGNVKQVVVFDAATGNKFFQVMDMATGQVIPNVPVYDQMFMEDTTLDLKTRIAKNINLNETFPIVVLNENSVQSQY